jgi:hypothetical protein
MNWLVKLFDKVYMWWNNKHWGEEEANDHYGKDPYNTVSQSCDRCKTWKLLREFVNAPEGLITCDTCWGQVGFCSSCGRDKLIDQTIIILKDGRCTGCWDDEPFMCSQCGTTRPWSYMDSVGTCRICMLLHAFWGGNQFEIIYEDDQLGKLRPVFMALERVLHYAARDLDKLGFGQGSEIPMSWTLVEMLATLSRIGNVLTSSATLLDCGDTDGDNDIRG